MSLKEIFQKAKRLYVSAITPSVGGIVMVDIKQKLADHEAFKNKIENERSLPAVILRKKPNGKIDVKVFVFERLDVRIYDIDHKLINESADGTWKRRSIF